MAVLGGAEVSGAVDETRAEVCSEVATAVVTVLKYYVRNWGGEDSSIRNSQGLTVW